MFTIENDQLVIKVKNKGAELDGIFSKKTKLEYLWSGDAAFWNKKSPILFPIVGTLKENKYIYKDKSYHLTRHGFARDMEFQMTSQQSDSIVMTLVSNANTLAVFPFDFKLQVTYSLHDSTLQVKYSVYNTGTGDMYFSIGGHPAFKIPLEEKLSYDDYYFEFNRMEDASRWMISHEGLIEPTIFPLLINNDKLAISRELFRKDAIVFKYLNSDKVKLKTNKSPHGIEVSFPRFSFIGLWAAPDANFVCVEPWCGIADSTTSHQQLIHKEGINLLTADQVFERTWSVSVY